MQKPQGRTKGLIYGLPKGQGFKIADLSVEWGISEENIRNHAKKLKCRIYVEETPGRYIECITNPESKQCKER